MYKWDVHASITNTYVHRDTVHTAHMLHGKRCANTQDQESRSYQYHHGGSINYHLHHKLRGPNDSLSRKLDIINSWSDWSLHQLLTADCFTTALFCPVFVTIGPVFCRASWSLEDLDLLVWKYGVLWRANFWFWGAYKFIWSCSIFGGITRRQLYRGILCICFRKQCSAAQAKLSLIIYLSHIPIQKFLIN